MKYPKLPWGPIFLGVTADTIQNVINDVAWQVEVAKHERAWTGEGFFIEGDDEIGYVLNAETFEIAETVKREILKESA